MTFAKILFIVHQMVLKLFRTLVFVKKHRFDESTIMINTQISIPKWPISMQV